ncbi:hypothetical protein NDU88_005697 [Pleurodeles waltl]|uniref:Uncharacterized protein n=1 Tax=Pleurodeles waltl TaxID=8319 RepID=A0AAV7RPQ8_PLEWA|nr:hypothetical protein NDU88_005697 [Pleurodeles waltl]
MLRAWRVRGGVVKDAVDDGGTIDDGAINGKVIYRSVFFGGVFVNDCVVTGHIDNMAQGSTTVVDTEEAEIVIDEDEVIISVVFSITTVVFSFLIGDNDAVNDDFVKVSSPVLTLMVLPMKTIFSWKRL